MSKLIYVVFEGKREYDEYTETPLFATFDENEAKEYVKNSEPDNTLYNNYMQKMRECIGAEPAYGMAQIYHDTYAFEKECFENTYGKCPVYTYPDRFFDYWEVEVKE